MQIKCYCLTLPWTAGSNPLQHNCFILLCLRCFLVIGVFLRPGELSFQVKTSDLEQRVAADALFAVWKITLIPYVKQTVVWTTGSERPQRSWFILLCLRCAEYSYVLEKLSLATAVFGCCSGILVTGNTANIHSLLTLNVLVMSYTFMKFFLSWKRESKYM